jgi:hypothetical protein
VRAGNFAGDAAALQAGADAQNPVLSGVLAGASSYFSGGGKTGMGGGAGSGNSLLTSGTSVSPKWYGTPSTGTPTIGNMG